MIHPHHPRTTLVVLGLLVATGCTQERPRPTCSEHDLDCGESWRCAESDTLELCTSTIICTGTRYTCVAQGILEPGEQCIADSECVEGAHCSPVDSSGEHRCRLDECESDSECGAGEICRHLECHTTLGNDCLEHRGEYGCSPHEICTAGECVGAPPGGGNECSDETYCAPGLECAYDPAGGLRCTTCVGDDQCTAAEAPYCYEGHCAVCSLSSCAPRQCQPSEGCVDCLDDEHCGDGERCVSNGCRRVCDFPNHDECPSGHCEVGNLCVAPVGTSCPEEAYDDDRNCFGGECVGVNADGSSVPFYCTRRCGSSSPPCPSGYECVENVEVDGLTEDLCIASP